MDFCDFNIFLSTNIGNAYYDLPTPLIFGDKEYSVCAKQIIIPTNFNNCDNCSITITIVGKPALELSISGICDTKACFIKKIEDTLNSEKCLAYFEMGACPIHIISSPANDIIKFEGDLIEEQHYTLKFNKKLGNKLGFGIQQLSAPFKVSNNGNLNMAYGDEIAFIECNLVEPSPFNKYSANILALINPQPPMRKSINKYEFRCPYMQHFTSLIYAPVAQGSYTFIKFKFFNIDGDPLVYQENNDSTIAVTLHFKKMC